MPSANPTFEWSQTGLEAVAADGLVVLLTAAPGAQDKDTKDDAPIPLWDERLKTLDARLGGLLQQAIQDEGFKGGKGQTLVLRVPTGGGLGVRGLVLAGVGEAKRLTPDRIETVVAKATGSLLGWKSVHTVAASLLTETLPVTAAQQVQAVVDGAYQATYRSGESLKPRPDLKTFTLLWPQAPDAGLQAVLSEGILLAEARSWSKDFVNCPSNLKTTQTMVDAALSLKDLPNVTVDIQSDVAWIAEQMPSFFTVAKGAVASDPPKFITARYTAPGDGPKRKLALVGKTVIFDTGGYQVKPDNSMVTMKGDMTGGAMVLGALRALAKLQPQGLEVTVYLAATPNKIDSDAMLPDSIVPSTSGKKIEIRHTDAEGRLTLIDAVAMAAKAEPEAILTIATLTGSAMRAVGLGLALMANPAAVDGGQQAAVLQAARSLGEPIQALDVWESDFDDIKSKLDGADILNTSQNKNRGAQSAAAFVMSGAPDTVPLVHLDIAGADMTHDEKATGIGQKTLIRWVLGA